MDPHDDLRRVYLELAEGYERRGQDSLRDRFLVLAADAAHRDGREDEAERLRLRLLQANPHHLLKPFSSFAEAAAAPDVGQYVRDLRANYPPDVAASLLRSLGAPGGQPAGRQIPVTAPLISLDSPAGNGGDPRMETLRLPPVQERPTPPVPRAPAAARPAHDNRPPHRSASAPPARPATPHQHPTRPAPVGAAAPPPKPVPPAPRAPRPASARPVPRVPVATPAPPPPPAPVVGPSEPEGAWLSAALSGVVLVAGLAAAALTLLEPLWAR